MCYQSLVSKVLCIDNYVSKSFLSLPFEIAYIDYEIKLKSFLFHTFRLERMAFQSEGISPSQGYTNCITGQRKKRLNINPDLEVWALLAQEKQLLDIHIIFENKIKY